jgi:hypothetical protein
MRQAVHYAPGREHEARAAMVIVYNMLAVKVSSATAKTSRLSLNGTSLPRIPLPNLLNAKARGTGAALKIR